MNTAVLDPLIYEFDTAAKVEILNIVHSRKNYPN